VNWRIVAGLCRYAVLHLSAEFAWIAVMPRSAAAQTALFRLVMRATRIFNAVLKLLAIGHNGRYPDGVSQFAFEHPATSAVILSDMDFLPDLKMRFCHEKPPVQRLTLSTLGFARRRAKNLIQRKASRQRLAQIEKSVSSYAACPSFSSRMPDRTFAASSGESLSIP
jgi:hypothetical protein